MHLNGGSHKAIVPGATEDRLQEISNKHKQKRGKRVSLSNCPLAIDFFPRDTIEQHNRGTIGKEHCDPFNPSLTKTFSSKNSNDSLVFNFIKGLLKVKFQKKSSLFG